MSYESFINNFEDFYLIQKGKNLGGPDTPEQKEWDKLSEIFFKVGLMHNPHTPGLPCMAAFIGGVIA